MFKFVKEMLDSADEGIAEGRAELAQERAEREASLAIARPELDVATATPDLEAFGVALAAPCRSVFASDALDGDGSKYQPIHLLRAALPERFHGAWRELLTRDFDVEDEEDTRFVLTALLGEFDASGGSALADDQALAAVAAALGARFDSWDALGDAFPRGERDAPCSNFPGRKFLAFRVDTLQTNADSPWMRLRWPSTSQVAGLAAAEGVVQP